MTSLSATNPKWLAPEILSGRPSSTASDVYAFGIVLWELLTWQLPWHDCGTWQVSSAPSCTMLLQRRSAARRIFQRAARRRAALRAMCYAFGIVLWELRHLAGLLRDILFPSLQCHSLGLL